MAEVTGISWCDSTANLWKGCQKVSPACDNCYAETLVCGRLAGQWGPHANRTHVKAGWSLIRKMQRKAAKNGGVDPELGRKRRIFINSLSDFFDNHRSVVWRDEAWDLIRESPDLIFILVTKRPENIVNMLPAFWGDIRDNIWIVITAENQKTYDHRSYALQKSFRNKGWPGVLGLSIEPLLGPIKPDPLVSIFKWFIVGSESGTKRRETDLSWVRSLRDYAKAKGGAFFVKQLPSGKAVPLKEIEDFPEDLRAREFPR